MALQITDNNWNLRVDETFSSDIDKYLVGSFSSPFVVVAVEAPDANPLWTKAGTIAQAILIDNAQACTVPSELSLGTLNLLKFESLTGTDYELYYFPPFRLGEVSLRVWEYQGQTRDAQVQQLVDALSTSDFLSQDFSALGQKIDLLIECLDCENTNTPPPEEPPVEPEPEPEPEPEAPPPEEQVNPEDEHFIIPFS